MKKGEIFQFKWFIWWFKTPFKWCFNLRSAVYSVEVIMKLSCVSYIMKCPLSKHCRVINLTSVTACKKLKSALFYYHGMFMHSSILSNSLFLINRLSMASRSVLFLLLFSACFQCVQFEVMGLSIKMCYRKLCSYSHVKHS